MNQALPTLPHLYRLPITGKTLETHRQQHPFSFERLIETDTYILRYASDMPSFCFGEYVCQQLQRTTPGRWLYIEPLDDEEKVFYVVSADNDTVIREQCGSASDLSQAFAYDLSQAEMVYFSGQNTLFFSGTCQPVGAVGILTVSDEFALVRRVTRQQTIQRNKKNPGGMPLHGRAGWRLCSKLPAVHTTATGRAPGPRRSVAGMAVCLCRVYPC